MGFLTLLDFFNEQNKNYGDLYNMSENEQWGNLTIKINESFYKADKDTTQLASSLQNRSGTQSTGEGSLLLNTFFGSMDFLSRLLPTLTEILPSIASIFSIPNYWVYGFMAIISITLFIIIVGGFLRTSNW